MHIGNATQWGESTTDNFRHTHLGLLIIPTLNKEIFVVSQVNTLLGIRNVFSAQM